MMACCAPPCSSKGVSTVRDGAHFCHSCLFQQHEGLVRFRALPMILKRRHVPYQAQHQQPPCPHLAWQLHQGPPRPPRQRPRQQGPHLAGNLHHHCSSPSLQECLLVIFPTQESPSRLTNKRCNPATCRICQAYAPTGCLHQGPCCISCRAECAPVS